jgi:hypothetical protein
MTSIAVADHRATSPAAGLWRRTTGASFPWWPLARDVGHRPGVSPGPRPPRGLPGHRGLRARASRRVAGAFGLARVAPGIGGLRFGATGWLSSCWAADPRRSATLLFTMAFTYGRPDTPVLLVQVQPLFAVAGARVLLGERLQPRYGLYLLGGLGSRRFRPPVVSRRGRRVGAPAASGVGGGVVGNRHRARQAPRREAPLR